MARPAVFASASFAEVLARSKAEGRLLVVDASAQWCGPCKAMERGAWADPELVAWLHANAIAFQFDVDEDEALARRLSIQAMPTIVAFREGEAFDRLVGLREPKQLVEWLAGVKRGETSTARAQARVHQGGASMRERMELASMLAMNEKLDEATEAYAWLWEHCLEHEPAFVGVRFSFLAQAITELTRRHPAARSRFAAMRDALLPGAMIAEVGSELLGDWFAMNVMLDECERTVRWFDAARPTLRLTPKALKLFELRVVPLLLERQRWADVGALYADPVATLRLALEHQEDVLASPLPAEMREELEVVFRDQLIRDAAQLRACLLAAGRSGEAEEVAAVARQHQGGEELERAFERMEREAKGATAGPSGG